MNIRQALTGVRVLIFKNSLVHLPCKHMFCLAKELGYFQGLYNLPVLKESDSPSDLIKEGELLPSQFAYFWDS